MVQQLCGRYHLILYSKWFLFNSLIESGKIYANVKLVFSLYPFSKLLTQEVEWSWGLRMPVACLSVHCFLYTACLSIDTQQAGVLWWDAYINFYVIQFVWKLAFAIDANWIPGHHFLSVLLNIWIHCLAEYVGDFYGCALWPEDYYLLLVHTSIFTCDLIILATGMNVIESYIIHIHNSSKCNNV